MFLINGRLVHVTHKRKHRWELPLILEQSFMMGMLSCNKLKLFNKPYTQIKTNHAHDAIWARSEVVTAVFLKFRVFWVVKTFRWIQRSPTFQRIALPCYFTLSSSLLLCHLWRYKQLHSDTTAYLGISFYSQNKLRLISYTVVTY